MLAIAGLLLAHVPPPVASLIVTELLIQAFKVPVIGKGDALTARGDVTRHPAGKV
jgi:hypothetical protein